VVRASPSSRRAGASIRPRARTSGPRARPASPRRPARPRPRPPRPRAPAPPRGAGQPPAVTPDGSVDAHVAAIGLEDHRRRWTVPLADVSQTGVTVEGTTAYVGDKTGTVTAIACAS